LIDGVAPKRFAGMNICHQFGQMCYRGFQPILYYGMTVDYLWIIGINGCSK